MSDANDPPSMDDILASIRRIIAEEDSAPADGAEAGSGPGAAATAPAATGPVPPPAPLAPPAAAVPPARTEEPLELTRRVEPVAYPANGRTAAPQAPAPGLVSDVAADASRQALAALSSLVITDAKDNTLEGLVREMLRPMLKAWLDDRLPTIVEAAVAREVARIAGKTL